jgi:hypothetical protein
MIPAADIKDDASNKFSPRMVVLNKKIEHVNMINNTWEADDKAAWLKADR